jgi:hypothetical protein
MSATHICKLTADRGGKGGLVQIFRDTDVTLFANSPLRT